MESSSVKSTRTNDPEVYSIKSSIYARTESFRNASFEDAKDEQRLAIDRDRGNYSHKHIPRTSTLDRSTTWILDHHQPNLILKLEKPVDSSPLPSLPKKKKDNDAEDKKPAEEDDVRYLINFSELQNMHVRKLQCKLVKRVLDLRISEYDKEGEGEWEDVLREYSMSPVNVL